MRKGPLSDTTGTQTQATDLDPAKYHVQETLRDGGSIVIRAIRSDDKERLREHSRGLSAESVYHRFMVYKRELSEEDLRKFTELDFRQHVGLAAIVSEDGREHFVGVGRYVRTSDLRAEVALSVIDKHQGRGIGPLLFAHLGRVARQQGIAKFEADVMGDNAHMLDMIAASGFKVQTKHDGGLVHLLVRISGS